MYAATEMWPDIEFAVLALAQFSQDPARTHWEATKHVVRYLKGTRDLELTYRASNPELSDIWMPTMPHNTTGIPYQVTPSLSMGAQSVGALRSSQSWLCLQLKQNMWLPPTP